MPFTPSQLHAAKLLASGQTQDEVAKQINVSRRTIVRWLCKEEFKNLCFGLVNSTSPPAKTQPEIQSAPLTENEEGDYSLQDLLPIALRRLATILNDPNSRTGDQLRAVALVGSWMGMDTDFNLAISCLRKYGFIIAESEDGRWTLINRRD